MIVTRSTAATRVGPTALTIGNFDGVHRGHQAMIERTIRAAAEHALVPTVLTFEPHPREFFTPDRAPARLTNLRTKLELLASLGIAHVHVQHFTRAFSAMSAESFISRVLAESLQARWILCGDDFRFGAKRQGDGALLNSMATRYGYTVASMPTIAESGERISSSAVRAALAAGDLARAERLLGRRYGISGRVIHGAKLGRQLGFPTANVQLTHEHPALLGIYAIRMSGYGDRVLDGVASLGFRPTVTNVRKATLEVHLFDFAGDLYGQHVSVEFLRKLRDEEKYPDLETLKAAIANDCRNARDWLARHPAEPVSRISLPQ